MKRYFKIIKTFPNSNAINSIFFIDKSESVYVLSNKALSSNQYFEQGYNKEDLEDKEYFEESIGISADGYVLFKNDKVYSSTEFTFNLSTELKSLYHFPTPLYFKQENIPVEKQLPKTWEDCNKKSGYSTTVKGDANKFKGNNNVNVNMYATEKQALSAIAFAQLSQLVAEMNGNDWIANWQKHNNQWKYFIVRTEFTLKCECSSTGYFQSLVFNTKESRDFSFEHHADLWKQYFLL